MNKETLIQFLIDSNKAGYAGGEEKKWIKESDGSTTIPYEKGDWRSHDNFFGGEPYGGRIVVYYEKKSVWMMVYYGWVLTGIAPDPIYAVLRNALKNMPDKAPFRGPKELKDEEYTYINNWVGDVERYLGEEQIIHGEQVIYKANYMGGFVDQRQGV